MTSLTLVRRIKARPQVVFDAGESRVEIALRAIPEGTELTFTHSRLHDEETRRSHEEGWGGALEKLMRRFQAPEEPHASARTGRSR